MTLIVFFILAWIGKTFFSGYASLEVILIVAAILSVGDVVEYRMKDRQRGD